MLLDKILIGLDGSGWVLKGFYRWQDVKACGQWKDFEKVDG